MAGKGDDAITFEAQSIMASEIAYDGLEITAFTLCNQPTDSNIRKKKQAAASARERAIELWSYAGKYAKRKDVIYCIEPLAPMETSFINTVEEATAIVKIINSSSLKIMIDTSSAGLSKNQNIADVIKKWVSQGNIAHIQLNSTNKGAPGDGNDNFYDIIKSIIDVKYNGIIAVEPFIYDAGGYATAKRAIKFIKNIFSSIN